MSRRILRDDEAASPDGVGEPAMAGWIDAVDSRAGDRNRVAPTVECAAMARRVDAGREAARDDNPEPADFQREGFGRDFAIPARMAAADDRQLRLGEEGGVLAVDPEGGRRIGNRGKPLGIERGAEGDQRVTGLLEPGARYFRARDSGRSRARGFRVWPP